MQSLYEHVPKTILPEEYGGDAGPMQNIILKWEIKFLEYRDYFLEDEKYGVDESRRIEKDNKTANVLVGLKGSFRKLEID